MRAIALIALATMSLAACGAKKSRTVKTPRVGDTENGIASWYGDPYHGRRTASGEVYDMEKMTAAHRTMAFQTWVKVENLSNGKTVDVRINDRGPFVRGRIIDLSRSAARSIDMLGPGTAKVRIEVIEKPRSVPASPPPVSDTNTAETRFGVQVGAFGDRENAARLAAELHRKFGSVRVVPREGNLIMWRVIVGDSATQEEAASLAAELAGQMIDGFVVRLDPALPVVDQP
jgi:rare lipoprotein A